MTTARYAPADRSTRRGRRRAGVGQVADRGRPVPAWTWATSCRGWLGRSRCRRWRCSRELGSSNGSSLPGTRTRSCSPGRKRRRHAGCGDRATTGGAVHPVDEPIHPGAELGRPDRPGRPRLAAQGLTLWVLWLLWRVVRTRSAATSGPRRVGVEVRVASRAVAERGNPRLQRAQLALRRRTCRDRGFGETSVSNYGNHVG